jgi:MFS family permease
MDLNKQTDGKNFNLLVLDGMLFFGAITFLASSTILPAFVSRLTTSSMLVGLVTAVRFSGWFLPQLFAANYLEKRLLKKPVMLITSFLSRLSIIMLAYVTYRWGAGQASVTLILFFALYFLFNLCEGVSTIAWMDIVAKTVTPTRRGSMFSGMQLTGSLLGIGAGVLIRHILNHPQLSFSTAYALIFFCGGILLFGDYLVLFLLEEPPGSKVTQERTMMQYLKTIPMLLRKNITFQRMVAIKILIGFNYLVLPFYVVYSQKVLATQSGIIGIYVLLQTAGMIGGSLLFGQLSDRVGNRSVILGTSIATAFMPVFALCVFLVSRTGAYPVLTSLYALVFLAIGFSDSGLMIGFTNYMLEIVSEEERPSYYGLSNTMGAVTAILPILGGFLVSQYSYELAFLIAAIFILVGLTISFGLPEPRRMQTTKEAYEWIAEGGAHETD